MTPNEIYDNRVVWTALNDKSKHLPLSNGRLLMVLWGKHDNQLSNGQWSDLHTSYFTFYTKMYKKKSVFIGRKLKRKYLNIGELILGGLFKNKKVKTTNKQTERNSQYITMNEQKRE